MLDTEYYSLLSQSKAHVNRLKTPFLREDKLPGRIEQPIVQVTGMIFLQRDEEHGEARPETPLFPLQICCFLGSVQKRHGRVLR